VWVLQQGVGQHSQVSRVFCVPIVPAVCAHRGRTRAEKDRLVVSGARRRDVSMNATPPKTSTRLATQQPLHDTTSVKYRAGSRLVSAASAGLRCCCASPSPGALPGYDFIFSRKRHYTNIVNRNDHTYTRTNSNLLHEFHDVFREAPGLVYISFRSIVLRGLTGAEAS
jgi:hypothetical protein